MDKRMILLAKMYNLLQEVEKAKLVVDESKILYLNNYKSSIELLIIKLENGILPSSKGGLIGTMRGISEYDSLANIKSLYDAAADVDLYYSKECQEW